MKFLLFTTLILTTLTTLNFANAGKGRGGQYMYYQSGVETKIELGQERALEYIKSIPLMDWPRIFPKDVDRFEFISILKNIKLSPTVFDRMRDRAHLVLDFIEENGVKKIEVLGRFYDLILYDKVPGSIEQNLIHEALHFFGYDQEEAWSQSQKIITMGGRGAKAFKFCDFMYKKLKSGHCVYYPQVNHSDEYDYAKEGWSIVKNEYLEWLRNGITTNKSIYVSAIVSHVEDKTGLVDDNVYYDVVRYDLSSPKKIEIMFRKYNGDNDESSDKYSGVMILGRLNQNNCLEAKNECHSKITYGRHKVFTTAKLHDVRFGRNVFDLNYWITTDFEVSSTMKLKFEKQYISQSFFTRAEGAIFIK